MRVLVHPHLMEVGGSQLNAIELADAIRHLGHEVVVYAPPGELVEEVHRRGLEMVLAPATRRATPSVSSALRLRRLVRNRKVDLVHSYEWTATLDTLFGPGLAMGTPMVATVLSMVVPRYLPATVPLIVGTNELLDKESSRRPEVYLMEPPIDVELNRPGATPFLSGETGAQTVRDRWGIPSSDKLIVLVGRLSPGLKLGGVLEAVRAMPLLSTQAHLLIVGDGTAREQVEELAAEVNAAANRRLVTVAGLLMDPRPAYSAADAVLGMGGSILRGMAFEKPVIVQGEHGFWRTLDAGSLPVFRHQGWFGLGGGEDGAPILARLLDELFAHPEQAQGNARLGREVVVEHYNLQTSAAFLVELYEHVGERRIPLLTRLRGCADAVYRLARAKLGRIIRAAEQRVQSAFPGLPQRGHGGPSSGPSWS